LKKAKQAKDITPLMQLPNDIPIWNSVKSVILGKFLIIFKVGYLLQDKTYINQNCWNYSTTFALL